MKAGDLLLLLLYVDGCSSIRGRTRLQKMAFVFEKELYTKYDFNKMLEKKIESPFEFNAHNFGPFSSKIFEMMDFFININMVKVKCDVSYEDLEEAVDGTGIDDEDINYDDLRELMLDDEEVDYCRCREPEYIITNNGKQYVKDRIIKYLSTKQLEAMTKLKQSFNRYSLHQILMYVYHSYPEMTKESQIKDKVLRRRE